MAMVDDITSLIKRINAEFDTCAPPLSKSNRSKNDVANVSHA